jgi:hypothetical protein
MQERRITGRITRLEQIWATIQALTGYAQTKQFPAHDYSVGVRQNALIYINHSGGSLC